MTLTVSFNYSGAANPATASRCHAEGQWRRFTDRNG
jgi:hypothetical protein